MSLDRATTIGDPHRVPSGPLFTPERANRALVLVRRIVADIVRRYKDLLALRLERDELLRAAAGRTTRTPGAVPRHERMEEVNQEIDRCAEELNSLNRELQATGCVLKDWQTGLVDFPALYRGRRVWLCWYQGEPTVAYWHEWNDGFGARMPIEADFSLQEASKR
jgi:hypothetical protein